MERIIVSHKFVPTTKGNAATGGVALEDVAGEVEGAVYGADLGASRAPGRIGWCE
jgi:hypothetical protein